MQNSEPDRMNDPANSSAAPSSGPDEASAGRARDDFDLSADLRTRYNTPEMGSIDHFIRRFNTLAHGIVILLLYALAATAYGLALAPALWFLEAWHGLWASLAGWPLWIVIGIGYALAFFIAGLALMIVVPVYNLLLPTRVRPFKGGYFSIRSVPWALHNALFYLVRYTFLPFATLTPFSPWFLRAMGMKLGKRAFINTEFISDPRLITLEDDVVIGGSVHLFAHYGGGGHLVVAPVVIGARTTIGQKATVMGDVLIGPDATILPHSVLLPGTRVGAGEIWGGVPARRISREEMDRMRDEETGHDAA
jgi:acetyltransferase-like isoleucine patch superfamily enzyme